MLSKLPWQKRSNRSNSRSAAPPVSTAGYVTQSQGADPVSSTSFSSFTLSTEQHAQAQAQAQTQIGSHPAQVQAHTQAQAQQQAQQQQQQQRSAAFLRSRSQRFSRQSLADGFNRLTSNRQSFIGSSNNSQTYFSEEPLPSSIPAQPEATPYRGLQRTESSRDLNAPSISTKTLPDPYSISGTHFREDSFSALWSSEQALPLSIDDRPSPVQSQDEVVSIIDFEADPMTTRTASTQGKTSSESAGSGLDRWSQRRLQRLNTEQGFREQRQGTFTAPGDQAQPHPSGQPTAYSRPTTNSSYGASSPPPPVSATTSPSYQYHDGPQVHIPTKGKPSPSDVNPNYPARQLPQAQSFGHINNDDASSEHNIVIGQPKPQSNNRHSGQANGSVMNPTSASSIPLSPSPQQQQQQQSSQQSQQQRTLSTAGAQAKEASRSTSQLMSAEDATDEEINQLINDHKELREKYNKVKKYYFEKEDQVKALQNSLAHQRISQSRTSLDDSEYATRFNRLDGLIAQLCFSIRKSWKTVPTWLVGSINKDAITTGKQEMTAAGRAIVSQWLVEEVFSMYFHPDLDITLSAQLKTMQKNIRKFAATASNQEDEEYLTSKIVNWRLTTLEGLQDALRSPHCAQNREQLIEMLKKQLTNHLQQHLDNPPISDLEGGVHMIIELAVTMVAHLPLESRDVQIEYFNPFTPINYEQMKPETGIPGLGTSLADEHAERASVTSTQSNATEDNKSSAEGSREHRKRDMLSALTGGGKKRDAKNASSTSLDQPRVQSGEKDELKVRMAVGIAAFVRNRTVLVKAPVFAM